MARVDDAKAKALAADALRKKTKLRGFIVHGVTRDEHRRITVLLTLGSDRLVAVFSGGELVELHVGW